LDFVGSISPKLSETQAAKNGSGWAQKIYGREKQGPLGSQKNWADLWKKLGEWTHRHFYGRT